VFLTILIASSLMLALTLLSLAFFPLFFKPRPLCLFRLLDLLREAVSFFSQLDIMVALLTISLALLHLLTFPLHRFE